MEIKEILPPFCYSLLGYEHNKKTFSIIIDNSFSGFSNNVNQLKTEYDFVILNKPKIDEKTINRLEELIDEEIEINLEIENKQKAICVWASDGELLARIICDDYEIIRQAISTEQWIRRYKSLLNVFYDKSYKAERKRIQIRDFKEKVDFLFKNELSNTIKKIDFFEKRNKENKVLKAKKELLSTFFQLIDEHFD